MWTEYLDRLYQPVRDKDNAEIIRVVRYLNSTPIDTLKEFDRSGHLLRCGVATRAINDKVVFDGRVMTFYPNGRVDEEENWENDKRNGPYQRYYPSGRLRVTGQFDNGERTGQWVSYFDSLLVGKKSARQQGIPKTQGVYTNGQKDGLWTSLTTIGGKIDSTWYIDGAPVDGLGFLRMAKNAAMDEKAENAAYFLGRAEQMLQDANVPGTVEYAYAEAVRATISFVAHRSKDAAKHIDSLRSTVLQLQASHPDLQENLEVAYDKGWTELGFTYAMEVFGASNIIRTTNTSMVVGEKALYRASREVSLACSKMKKADSIDAELALFRAFQQRFHAETAADSEALMVCALSEFACRVRAAKLRTDTAQQCAIRRELLQYLKSHENVKNNRADFCFRMVGNSLDTASTCDDQLLLQIIEATSAWNQLSVDGETYVFYLRLLTLNRLHRFREVMKLMHQRLADHSVLFGPYFIKAVNQSILAHYILQDCGYLSEIYDAIRASSDIDMVQYMRSSDIKKFVQECGVSPLVEPPPKKAGR